MTIHGGTQDLRFQLYHFYETREADNIADLVMEKVTGWKRIDRVLHKKALLSGQQQAQLLSITESLLLHTPVQYVLEEAWFYGLPLYVNKDVLIPRPETEELVHWVLQTTKEGATSPVVLDIGTGSGCIPLAIKKNLPGSAIYATDISAAALAVAAKNAVLLQLDIHCLLLDVLSAEEHPALPPVDIMISNPPYIPLSEKASMAKHVVDFEPHLALFTGDADPLVFYRAVAALAKKQLQWHGWLFLEIHEDRGQQVEALLAEAGFTDILLKKDMQGKDRMIRCMKEAV